MKNNKFNKYLYLGSPITAYAAIILPIFIFAPIIWGGWLILNSPLADIFIIVIGCILTSFLWIFYFKQKINHLYAWGKFESNGVRINKLFKKNFIDYDDFKYIGIACYTHGVLNSSSGTKQIFIVFSTTPINTSYKTNINLWNPPINSFKIKFNTNLYNHLLNVLPEHQQKLLKADFKTNFE